MPVLEQDESKQRRVPDSLANLTMFRDEPLFGDTYNQNDDAFGHEAFAEALLKLLRQNAPPLSIGLFGSWGIGKSTILNILKDKLAGSKDNKKFRYLYFNAWKYSADSFRRQFLIEVARQVYGDTDPRTTRLHELNYASVLKANAEGSLIVAFKKAFREAWDLKVAVKSTGVARIVVGIAAVLGAVVIAALFSGRNQLITALLPASVIPAVFLWFSKIKFEDLFVLQEAPVHDPKFVFPEQFEDEFKKIIASPELSEATAVIAIDDIDRCEAPVIRDILAATKHFIGQQRCVFIVPCDERTVVKVFDEPSQREGYADESLRKYFNIGVRIPPINSTDLIDFANGVARRTSIPEGIVQLAVLAKCRDARKMKHFLNSFIIRYQIAKAREARGLIKPWVDDNLEELAKAVLIEDLFPDVFSRIVENPRLYSLLEQSSISGELDPELEPLGFSKWGQSSWPDLQNLLKNTRETALPHAQVLFSLKATNLEARIPSGLELRSAVLNGKTDEVKTICGAATNEQSRTAIADLFMDSIRRSTAKFLQNSIAAALGMVATEGFFTESDARRVAATGLRALLNNSSIDILRFNASDVVTCMRMYEPNTSNRLLAKYEADIDGNVEPSPPPNFRSVLEHVLAVEAWRERIVSAVNRRYYTQWVSSDEGLAVLRDLQLPVGAEGIDLPASAVASKIFAAITYLKERVAADTLRRDLLLRRWSDEFTDPFVAGLGVMIQKTQAISYDEDLKFVFTSLMLRPELLTSKNASVIWNALPAIAGRLTNAEAKIASIDLMTLFAIKSSEPSTRSAAANTLPQYWQSLSDPAVRERLLFIEKFDGTHSEELLQSALKHQIANIQSERESINDRTVQRIALCAEYRSKSSGDDLFKTVISGLDVGNDSAFVKWAQIERDYVQIFGGEFAEQLTKRVLSLFAGYAGRTDRLRELAAIFSTAILGVTQPSDSGLVRQYFDLLKHGTESIRDAAAQGLRELRKSMADKATLFRLNLSRVIGDLRREVPTGQLAQYRIVLQACTEHLDLFDDVQLNDLSDIALRLLAASDSSSRSAGVMLVEAVPRIAENDPNGFAQTLLTIVQTAPDLSAAATGALRTVRHQVTDENILEQMTTVLGAD